MLGGCSGGGGDAGGSEVCGEQCGVVLVVEVTCLH